ncbi:MAG: hypothetical protein ACFFDN_51345 [Candidatus Hodarchaeota archaeon]
MNNLDILENNLFFRIFAGLNTIIIGLFLLICYLNRNKKNTWGQMYSSIYVSLNQIAKFCQAGKVDKAPYDMAWLFLSIICIFGGIIGIFFGFG